MSAQDSIQYYSLERAINLSNRLLEAVRTTSKVAGITAGVAKPECILWEAGYGYADVEKRIPMEPSKNFRIASLSKVLTAAGLARLYQEDRIDLDTPIMKYLPDLPPAFAGVTARQLAGHTSGVRHYIDSDFKTSLIDFKNFFGAFYLFAINTVFIPLSSVIISQILKFPIRASLEPSEKVRVNRAISAVIILCSFPVFISVITWCKKNDFQKMQPNMFKM